MSEKYSDLLGRLVHPTKQVVTYGAASMTTQVFAEGGLKKKLDQAHLNGHKEGYREGYQDGAEAAYQQGFEDGLKARVFAYVEEALAEKTREAQD